MYLMGWHHQPLTLLFFPSFSLSTFDKVSFLLSKTSTYRFFFTGKKRDVRFFFFFKSNDFYTMKGMRAISLSVRKESSYTSGLLRESKHNFFPVLIRNMSPLYKQNPILVDSFCSHNLYVKILTGDTMHTREKK